MERRLKRFHDKRRQCRKGNGANQVRFPVDRFGRDAVSVDWPDLLLAIRADRGIEREMRHAIVTLLCAIDFFCHAEN